MVRRSRPIPEIRITGPIAVWSTGMSCVTDGRFMNASFESVGTAGWLPRSGRSPEGSLPKPMQDTPVRARAHTALKMLRGARACAAISTIAAAAIEKEEAGNQRLGASGRPAPRPVVSKY
jgi:hypothetical protein